MIVSKSYLPWGPTGATLRAWDLSYLMNWAVSRRAMFQSKGGEKWETPVADDGPISIYIYIHIYSQWFLKVSGDRNDDCWKWHYSRGGGSFLCLVFFFGASLDPKTLQRWWFYGSQVTALVMESSHWSDRCTERGDADRPIKIIRGIRPGMIFL